MTVPPDGAAATLDVIPMAAERLVAPPTRPRPGSDAYPFTEIVGRESEEMILRRWLLGGDGPKEGQGNTPPVRPLGGAALVTGFRGVGKTCLVKKVLHDCMLAGRGFCIKDADGVAKWGPFAITSKKKGPSLLEAGSGFEPVLFVPVFVDVANAISPEALLHRAVRRTYLELTRYRVGELRPDLMRRLRLDYLRTLGELSLEASQKITQSFGVTLEGLAKLSVTAEQEIEFAETLKLVAQRISIEEAEDELVEVGGLLAAGPQGGRSWVGGRILDAARQELSDWIEWLKERPGCRVHVVYVLDELDKLQDDGEDVETLARFEADGQGVTEAAGFGGPTVTPTRTIGRVTRSVSRGVLTNAVDVVAQLKTLFSSRDVSAIVIGGPELEDEWLDETAEHDPTLRSVFTRHVYVRQAPLATVQKFLRGAASAGMSPEATARYVALSTRGRYKHMLLAAHEISREVSSGDAPRDPARKHIIEMFAALAGDWGSCQPQLRGAPIAADAFAQAKDVEALATLLVSAGLPLRRASEYGVDCVRALLAASLVALADRALITSPKVQSDLLDDLVRRAARFVPPALFASALEQLIKLARDHVASTAG